jgi:hypothetical protein
MNGAPDRGVIIRDLIIFQIKLFLDGLKDFIVSPVALGAAGLDLLFPTRRRGHRFYSVMRVAERFDGWLNLYGAAEHAEQNEAGLFGESRAGTNTLLGRLEEFAIGRRELDEEREAPATHM